MRHHLDADHRRESSVARRQHSGHVVNSISPWIEASSCRRSNARDAESANVPRDEPFAGRCHPWFLQAKYITVARGPRPLCRGATTQRMKGIDMLNAQAARKA
jgi:hypothetical protein